MATAIGRAIRRSIKKGNKGGGASFKEWRLEMVENVRSGQPHHVKQSLKRVIWSEVPTALLVFFIEISRESQRETLSELEWKSGV